MVRRPTECKRADRQSCHRCHLGDFVICALFSYIVGLRTYGVWQGGWRSAAVESRMEFQNAARCLRLGRDPQGAYCAVDPNCRRRNWWPPWRQLDAVRKTKGRRSRSRPSSKRPGPASLPIVARAPRKVPARAFRGGRLRGLIAVIGRGTDFHSPPYPRSIMTRRTNRPPRRAPPATLCPSFQTEQDPRLVGGDRGTFRVSTMPLSF